MLKNKKEHKISSISQTGNLNIISKQILDFVSISISPLIKQSTMLKWTALM